MDWGTWNKEATICWLVYVLHPWEQHDLTFIPKITCVGSIGKQNIHGQNSRQKNQNWSRPSLETQKKMWCSVNLAVKHNCVRPRKELYSRETKASLTPTREVKGMKVYYQPNWFQNWSVAEMSSKVVSIFISSTFTVLLLSLFLSSHSWDYLLTVTGNLM